MTETVKPFAHHLGLHSDFSLGESMLQIKDAVTRAKELGYGSVALVDTMTISSMVELTNQATKAGLNPIVGCTLRVYDDPTYRKEKGDAAKQSREVRVKAFVQTEEGLQNLIRVLSRANTEERFYYNARLGFDDLMELGGCILTTGDFLNLFHHPNHRDILTRLKTGPAPIYVEVCPLNSPLWITLGVKALSAAHDLDLPVVVTMPTLYATDEDAPTLDVLRGIRDNTQLKERWLPRQFLQDLSLHVPDRLVTRVLAYAPKLDYPELIGVPVGALLREGVRNIGKIADACTYRFAKQKPCLPKMATDEFATLKGLCRDGFKVRLLSPVLSYQPSTSELPKYVERLSYELGVIEKMGFAGYFLLVREIVAHAKSQGIMVGPGRGSVGGSLIAYLLGITEVDPIRFNLLFERFINPERIDLPDADLDFMSKRRHEVIQYAIDRFGEENVAGISNFTTMQAAGALRDVARIHGLDPFDYACSKLMEKEHGVSLSLEESAAVVPDVEKFKIKHPIIWNHATKLEGCMRGLGQHAAGIVIADRPVSERAVVETRTGGRVVNWDKKYVEDWGLIKIDVLGLTTLDVLAMGAQYVKEQHGVDVDYLAVDLTDKKVLDAFAAADTTGIFQYESAGMRKLLSELAMGSALTFEDLVAVTALFRPGPLEAGMCEEYVGIKQGVRVPYYVHPNVEVALKPTFGVLVYQEQVMQVARDYAGLTMAEADHIRKAMGKKDADKMAEWKERFVKGACVTSGVTEEQAGALWAQIEGFASYGFNRSHAVEYAIISFWAMWLKVHYPAAFYAASLSIQDKEEKLGPLVLDAKDKGIKVLPPDINRSSTRIEVHGPAEVYAPFQAIKGISDNVAAAIVELRETAGAWFKSPDALDPTQQKALCPAWPRVKINAAHREALRRVGAFWSLDHDGPDPLHADRLKDRIELMPGWSVDLVKAERAISTDRIIQLKLLEVVGETRACTSCSLKGATHVAPRMGKTPKFMVVFDSPSWQEEKTGRMLEGDSGRWLKAALDGAGLSANDGYYTALVKAMKPKAQKALTNEQINGCSQYLAKEIELLKPPVIFVLGSAAMRHFAPQFKGSTADLAGKSFFDAKLDATIVVGINPMQIHHDTTKAMVLLDACKVVAQAVKK